MTKKVPILSLMLPFVPLCLAYLVGISQPLVLGWSLWVFLASNYFFAKYLPIGLERVLINLPGWKTIIFPYSTIAGVAFQVVIYGFLFVNAPYIYNAIPALYLPNLTSFIQYLMGVHVVSYLIYVAVTYIFLKSKGF